MKKGWIIINHFLKTNKFSELYDFFKKAAEKNRIELKFLTNAETTEIIYGGYYKPDFVIFFDKDIRLAKLLESIGLKLFNCADAIETCDDKYLTYLKLVEHKVSTPYTLPIPMTYKNIGYNDTSFMNTYSKLIGFPAVIKENFGSFGMQVYLANNMYEFKKIIETSAPEPMIIQKYISESFGRDIRIYLVGGKIIAAMERRSTNNDFRANLSIGGSMKNYIPDSEASKLAISATKALNLDFCGVDLLFTETGYTVCEVNSNAHFKNIFDLTGVNFAEEILKYIQEKI